MKPHSSSGPRASCGTRHQPLLSRVAHGGPTMHRHDSVSVRACGSPCAIRVPMTMTSLRSSRSASRPERAWREQAV